MQEPIYLFSNKITFKRFKGIWEKFPSGGIVPQQMPKIVWQMIKDKQIYVYLDGKQKDDPVIIALKLPKRKIKIIS